MKRTIVIVRLAAVFGLLILSACGGGDSGKSLFAPASIKKARHFVQLMTSGDATGAVDDICTQPEGPIVLVAMDINWVKDEYKLVSDTESSAMVEVIGRFQISSDEIKQFVVAGLGNPSTPADLEQQLERLNGALPKIQGVFALDVDFEDFALTKNSQGDWCVDKSTPYEFLKYLVGLIESSVIGQQ